MVIHNNLHYLRHVTIPELVFGVITTPTAADQSAQPLQPMTLNACAINKYLKKRPKLELCLVHTILSLQPNTSDSRHLECKIEDIKERLRDLPNYKLNKKTRLMMDTLNVKEVNNELQISFWCKSGTTCFQPDKQAKNCAEVAKNCEKVTKNCAEVAKNCAEVAKNCAEVAMFGVMEQILHSVKGVSTCTASINWTADLSPCQVCTKRIPKQLAKLESLFPNTKFSACSFLAVMSYEDYEKHKTKKNTKALKKKLLTKLSELTKQQPVEDFRSEIMKIICQLETIIEREEELPDTSPAA